MLNLINKLIRDDNIESACSNLLKKKDSCGNDGMYLSELPDYLLHNKNLLLHNLINGDFDFSIAEKHIILGRNGKKRESVILNSVDRLVLRMLYQTLSPVISNTFSDNSFAYIEGRGIQSAVEKVRNYIESGLYYVAEIDIKDYFDSISHEILYSKLKIFDLDDTTMGLIENFLKIKVKFDNQIQVNRNGIIQGSSLSPLLSNLFLSDLDHRMERESAAYIRFSDDIKIFSSDFETASSWFSQITTVLSGYKLKTSERKCGVFPALNRSYFGYEFTQTKNGIQIQRRIRGVTTRFKDWNASRLEWRNGEYHIISDGILTKKDFSILFENPEKKMYIPVEVTDSISIYSDVILSSNFLRFANAHRLSIRFFDSYGEYVGTFTSSQQKNSVRATMNQSVLYLNQNKRLQLAKKIIIAGTHNVKCNIQYYKRRYENKRFDIKISEVAGLLKQMNEAISVEQLMLIEARMREIYYSCFDSIIRAEGFEFEKRSRRPPRNEVNAMISFGNTILYNHIANAIMKTELDIRISFLHSSNRRAQSLNLDIAEIFKPVIVDRLIFSLTNKHIIVASRHFTHHDGGAVLFNADGKRIFLDAFKDKLQQMITVKGERISYQNLIKREILNLKDHILNETKYTPYRYE